MPVIQLAMFDMAATTVDDLIQKPDFDEPLPLVISAFQDAFRKGGIEMEFSELNQCRGRDKMEVFQEKVRQHRPDLNVFQQSELAERLHSQEFVPALLENIPYICEVEGSTEAFQYLKNKGVFIATGSGFPQIVTDQINLQLGWKKAGLVDFGTCGESAGGGRPHPHMINSALIAAGRLPSDIDISQPADTFDYGVVLKVGDTIQDVKEGLAVGAYVVAVTSGTQTKEQLLQAGAHAVLDSVKDLPEFLERNNFNFPIPSNTRERRKEEVGFFF